MNHPETESPDPAASLPLVRAYTDGSCLKNPGGKSAGSLVMEHPDGSMTTKTIAFLSSTNQRAELHGLLLALESCPPDHRLLVRSDSMYVVEGLRKHLASTDGHLPTANRDLWIRVMDKARTFPWLRAIWLKGHAGNPGNELADQLAGEAAANGPWIEDTKDIPGAPDLFGDEDA